MSHGARAALFCLVRSAQCFEGPMQWCARFEAARFKASATIGGSKVVTLPCHALPIRATDLRRGMLPLSLATLDRIHRCIPLKRAHKTPAICSSWRICKARVFVQQRFVAPVRSEL